LKKIVLRKGREISVMRRHPWIFSGAVYSKDEDLLDGDHVQILDSNDNIIGTGHYQKGSICVRILDFQEVDLDLDFWVQKIKKAYDLRKVLGLIGHVETNCFRLINAEGDGLSGLIIDIYGSAAVIQCHSIGMHLSVDLIRQALQLTFGNDIKTIYDKNKLNAKSTNQSFVLGDTPSGLVLENGLKFKVDWVEGQKTGFFLDQRENRKLLKKYSKGKKVLNTFCYTGGFSVYAQAAGASLIDSVDVSSQAVKLAAENMDLNGGGQVIERNEITSDVMKYLRDCTHSYDVIIVDPPAFAKSQRKRHNAVQAYKRLNSSAFRTIAKDGIVFTFSCSQVVDRALFNDTIRAAAIEAKRDIQVLHHLSQPADHPTNIFHPEGSYLKGLVLKVH